METSTQQRPEVSKSKPDDLNEIQEDPVEKEELDNPVPIEESTSNIPNKAATMLENWKEFFNYSGD